MTANLENARKKPERLRNPDLATALQRQCTPRANHLQRGLSARRENQPISSNARFFSSNRPRGYIRVQQKPEHARRATKLQPPLGTTTWRRYCEEILSLNFFFTTIFDVERFYFSFGDGLGRSDLGGRRPLFSDILSLSFRSFIF